MASQLGSKARPHKSRIAPQNHQSSHKGSRNEEKTKELYARGTFGTAPGDPSPKDQLQSFLESVYEPGRQQRQVADNPVGIQGLNYSAGDHKLPMLVGDDKAPTIQQTSRARKNNWELACTPVLRTGQDAINFFAQYGAHTPLKFVHLTGACGNHDVDFRPYDLLVVDPRDCGSDYYTMSAAGLVRVAAGQQSECILLSEWLRASTLFKVLRNIRFFKFFLPTKALHRWKKNVRYKLFCRQRHRLAAKLFLAHESFCSPLLELKKQIVDIRDVKLIDLSQKTFEPPQFLEAQTTRRSEAAKQLEALMEKVSAFLQQTYKEVSELSQSLANKQSADHSLDELLDLAFKGLLKSKSLVAVKEENAARKQLMLRAEREAGMLPALVRLIDYIAVETLTDLAITTSRDMLGELVKPTKAGLFETTIRFTDEGTSFVPPIDVLQEMMSSTLEGIVTTTNSVNRVLYLKVFHDQLGDKLPKNGPVVSSIIRNSREFQDTAAEIHAKVNADYREAAEYVVTFETVRPVFDLQRSWEQGVSNKKATTAQGLKEQMNQYAAWEREVENMRARQQCGMLEVESRKLRALLMPLLAEKMDAVKTLTREFARAKCKQHTIDYKSRINRLIQRPQALKDFVNYVQAMEEDRTQDRARSRECDAVEQLYSLLANHKVNVPTEDIVALDELKLLQHQYHIESEAGRKYREERLPDITQQLDSSIIKLNDQLAALKCVLDAGTYADVQFFSTPQSVLGQLEGMQDKIATLGTSARTFSEYQDLLTLENNGFKNLHKLQEQFDSQLALWRIVIRWNQQYDQWMTEDFAKLNVSQVNKDVQTYLKDAYSMHKTTSSEVTTKLKDLVQDFKNSLSIITNLSTPAMRPRHWQKLFGIFNQPWYPEVRFRLKDLLNYGLLKYEQVVAGVCATAVGEAQLEQSLAGITSVWEHATFTVIESPVHTEIQILSRLGEMFAKLESDQAALQSMAANRHYQGLRPAVEKWEATLALIAETLEGWIKVQDMVLCLREVFAAEDVQRQLPQETQQFATVEQWWQNLMLATRTDPQVMTAIKDNGVILQQLQATIIVLEETQSALEEYLNYKRAAYPRFYFLANNELLDIVSQARNPQSLQPHLHNLFEGLRTLSLTEEGPPGSSTWTLHGFGDGTEEISLSIPADFTGAADVDLQTVEDCIRKTLKQKIAAAVGSAPPSCQSWQEVADWLWSHPAQAILTAKHIIWTQTISTALTQAEVDRKHCITQLMLNLSRQMEKMVAMMSHNLHRRQRLLLASALTSDFHARDTTRDLVDRGVDSDKAYDWQRQLRARWLPEEQTVVMHQLDWQSHYGYEYIGNTSRLVVTPLTDRTFLSLTGALSLKANIVLMGITATGKTETVRELARLLGLQLMIHTCANVCHTKHFDQFLSGLAQQGAWGCLDHLDRLPREVLPTLVQYLTRLQEASITGVSEVYLDGSLTTVKPTFAVFGTITQDNDRCRTQTVVPRPIEALFRPIATIGPDRRVVVEGTLISSGFHEAEDLSRKLTNLLMSAEDQLSIQAHYDFGLRALKGVLRTASVLKLQSPQSEEAAILSRATWDCLSPQLAVGDTPLFRAMLKKSFPSPIPSSPESEALQRAIEAELDKEQLEKNPAFSARLLQLCDLQSNRHSVLLCGEAGSGKSTAIMIVARAVSQLWKTTGNPDMVERLVLCPKVASIGELYGHYNSRSGKWHNGLLPAILQDSSHIVTHNASKCKWIVFDGPLDTSWTDCLLTAMEGNRTLCLASSEQIQLPPTTRLIFEAQDLQAASPAFINRCGVMRMSAEDLKVSALLRAWNNKALSQILPSTQSKILLDLLNEHLEATLIFVQEACTSRFKLSPSQLTRNTLRMLEAVCSQEGGFKSTEPQANRMIRLYLIWCIVWAIGGTVYEDSREVFQTWLAGRVSYMLEGDERAWLSDLWAYSIQTTSAKLIPWTNLVEAVPPRLTQPCELLVSTAETTKHGHVINRLIRSGFSVHLVGRTNVGKTALLTSTTERLRLDQATTTDYVIHSTLYTTNTEVSVLRRTLEKILERKHRTVLAPAAGKKMVLFIDDIHLPVPDASGTQPTSESLRQILDWKGYHDSHRGFISVKDTTFAACSTLSASGAGRVGLRLLSHLFTLWIPAPTASTLRQVLQTVLQCSVIDSPPSLTSMAASIAEASIAAYMSLLQIPAAVDRHHYNFSVRDLCRVAQSVWVSGPSVLSTPTELIHLWLHEFCRVFGDRMSHEEDRTLLHEALQEAAHKHLGHSILPQEIQRLKFGGYLSRESALYLHIKKDIPELRDLIMEYVEEHNISSPTPLSFTVTPEVVEHLSRVCRILRQPQGHALLMGPPGSGRRAVVQLAAFMCDCRLQHIRVTPDYGLAEFQEDLRAILINAGAVNIPIVLLLSDTQLVHESFLDTLSQLLANNYVHELLTEEDMQKVFSHTRLPPAVVGQAPSQEMLVRHFQKLVQANLHIVLVADPTTPSFRRVCQDFPSLLSYCHVDWWDCWSIETLTNVAQDFWKGRDLTNLDLFGASLGKVAAAMPAAVAGAWQQSNQKLNLASTSPALYLDMLQVFIDLYSKGSRVLSKNRALFNDCLTILALIEHRVIELQIKLHAAQPWAVDAAAISDEAAGPPSDGKSPPDIMQGVSRDISAGDTATQEQLERAARVLSSCDRKKTRCERALIKVEAAIRSLPATMLLCAGLVTYLGCFQAENRDALLTEWKTLCRQEAMLVQPDLSLSACLGYPGLLSEYQMNGLRSHRHSIENALVILHARRWPLIIDPEGEAARWICQAFARNDLQVLSVREAEYVSRLEAAIRSGATVLLQHAHETLDPTLEHVLSKQLFRKGRQFMVQLGETEIPWNVQFRLLLATSSATSCLATEMCAQFTVVNCDMRTLAVEEQLLNDIVACERPDIEAIHTEAMSPQGLDVHTNAVKELKDLQACAEAVGAPDCQIQPEALLCSSQVMAATETRLAEAEARLKVTEETREFYRSIARRGAIIWQVLAQLSLADPIYHRPLHWLRNAVCERLKAAADQVNSSERVNILTTDITQAIVGSINSVLCKMDGRILLTMVAGAIERQAGFVSEKEWQVFCCGPNPDALLSTQRYGLRSPPILYVYSCLCGDLDLGSGTLVRGRKKLTALLNPDRLSGKLWREIAALESDLSPIFGTLTQDISKRSTVWSKYLTQQDVDIPEPWCRKLTEFQKLLLARILRPGGLLPLLDRYTQSKLGIAVIGEGQTDLESALNASSPTTPILLLDTKAARSTKLLLDLAQSRGMIIEQELRIFSAGQGQRAETESTIVEACKTGHWVCIENCHLAVDVVQMVEDLLQQITADPSHTQADFRLWLTSTPSRGFPAGLLPRAITVVIEPIQGLRAQMLYALSLVRDEEWQNPPVLQAAILALTWFHAILSERCRWDADGYKCVERWTHHDFQAAVKQACKMFKSSEQINWEALRRSVAEQIYEGGVQSDTERKELENLAKWILNPHPTKDNDASCSPTAFQFPIFDSLELVKQHVEAMSSADEFRALGLDENLHLLHQEKESCSLCERLRSRAGGNIGLTESEGCRKRVAELARALIERLPGPMTYRGTQTDPVELVIRREILQLNCLLIQARRELTELLAALATEDLLWPAVSILHECLRRNVTPDTWRMASCSSNEDVDAWVSEQELRARTLADWQSQTGLMSIWLGAFTQPEAFLNALRQAHAQARNVLVDSVDFKTKVLKSDGSKMRQKPKEGIYVHGVSLRWARWNYEGLTLARASLGTSLDRLPCLWLVPATRTENIGKPVYQCPLYRLNDNSSSRACTIALPTDEAPDAWSRRKVCIVCSSNIE